MTLNQHLSPKQLRLADAIRVKAEVRAHYEPMMPDLLAFYREEGYRLPDPELMIAIDKRFANRMTKEICEPLGFFQGACVFVATILLRQQDARLA